MEHTQSHTKTTSALSTGSDAMTANIPSINPANGQVMGRVPIMSEGAVKEAMSRAREAQRGFAKESVHRRAKRVLEFRDIIVEHTDELVDALVKECGKPRLEALGHEVATVANLATYYAKHAERILSPRDIALEVMKHRGSYVRYEPLGVVGIISPWNFPFSIPMGDVFAALIAGNAVVLKPSEVTPLIALKAKELFDRTTLPQDLFQVVTGDGQTGAALIDAEPDKVIFTGAVSTGKKVAAECGRRLIPCTMELGGKAAAIVTDNVDVERTARAIVWGAFANSGQVCVSVERVLAHEKVHDELVDRVIKLVDELRQGDPNSDRTDVGAMTFAAQVPIVESLIKDAVDKGAKVATGGERLPGEGDYFKPTVLTGCTANMKIMHEEIFGPVMPVMRVRSVDEAVELNNDSHLGLMSYVFSKNTRRGCEIAERLDSGVVMVNDVLSAHAMPETPFGGIKQSGFGRVHGEEGLRSLCRIKHINYDRISLGKREPVWFPYSASAYSALAKATRVLFGGGNIIKRLFQ